jgi:hypothetical protein
MQPRVPQDKDQQREIGDLGLMQPPLARPDPSAQGGEVPGSAGGRIVREEIKRDHGVDLPRGASRLLIMAALLWAFGSSSTKAGEQRRKRKAKG